MRSRLLAGLLIAALCAPIAEAWTTGEAHGCTTHVCHCRTKHPATPVPREEPKPCHDMAKAKESVPVRDCAMRSACRHATPQLASSPPYVVVAPLVPFQLIDTERSRPDAPPAPLVGYGRLDPRPPRKAA